MVILKLPQVLVLSAVAWTGVAFAAAPAKPSGGMPWTSVRTNDIARWKAVHKASAGLRVDRAARRVTVLAEAAGLPVRETVEFVFIDPRSDRAYESFAVTVADAPAIAAAFEAIGVARGFAPNATAGRLWPQGEKIAISVREVATGVTRPLGEALKDRRAGSVAEVLTRPVLYTGGANASSAAETFACFNSEHAIFQFDDQLDQSVNYGRFVPAREYATGTLLEFVFEPAAAAKRPVERTVVVGTNANLVAELKALRAEAEKADLYVRLAFGDGVTVAQAAAASAAFAQLDGGGVRMNGCAPGQFFFRAFLPDAAWRAREGRIFQPFEVRVKADGSKVFTVVEEDWSGDGDDPVLKPRDTPFSSWSELKDLVGKARGACEKVSVLFLFVPPDAKVSDLTGVLEATMPRLNTFYVFPEEAAAQ